PGSGSAHPRVRQRPSPRPRATGRCPAAPPPERTAMRERALSIVVIGAILLDLFADPRVIASAGTYGYFACPAIRFFQPCPDLDEDASDMRPERITRDPAVLPERQPAPDLQALPIESIWAEPGRSSDARGTIYMPPRPVREFLEAPTAERAQAYLA